MRRTVAEYWYRFYHVPLPSSFLNKSVFELGPNVSSDLGENLLAVLAKTRCPASEHNDVKRVPNTIPLVAASSSSAEGTIITVEVR